MVAAAPDTSDLTRHAAYVREQLFRLRQLATTTGSGAFAAPGTWLASGARHALRTAIEALVDLAFHLCVRTARQSPSGPQDAFERLARARLLRGELLAPALEVVGFGERLGYGYDGVDDAFVYTFLRERLDGIEALLGALEAAGAR